MRQLVSLIVAVLAAIIAIPLLGGAAIFGGASCVPTPAAPSTSAAAVPGPVASGGPIPAFDGWDGEQLSQVATILTVGNTKAVPPWGWVVATATAMQESGLRNLPGGADDSIGLFQQRPSQGWGTPQQLRNPAYQAGKFFDKLVTVEGWQQMPLTQAAQKVQLSAYPDAYEKHTAEAIRLVSQVGSEIGLAIPGDLEQCVSNCSAIVSSHPADLRQQQSAATGVAAPSRSSAATSLKIQKPTGFDSVLTRSESAGQRFATAHDQPEPTSHVGTALGLSTVGINPCSGVSAQGWTQPVRAPVVSGFRTSARPGHDGTDLGAARHTTIVAAASGSVERVRCNAIDDSTGGEWGCDRDGSPEYTSGCGWYVDIAHPGGIVTRYCHMQTEPYVKVGDPVIAGQPIGEVGSTGHSSGPHLHYEVHVNSDSSSAGAVDPEGWMTAHGAPLGQP